MEVLEKRRKIYHNRDVDKAKKHRKTQFQGNNFLNCSETSVLLLLCECQQLSILFNDKVFENDFFAWEATEFVQFKHFFI